MVKTYFFKKMGIYIVNEAPFQKKGGNQCSSAVSFLKVGEDQC